MKLKAISLFSGGGGDTLGMIMAGIEVVGYVENDKDSIATHEHNFKNTKLIGKDIKKIKNEEFEKYKNNIDIIFGGFPCQSFSHGGKKNPTDSRGFLYQEFIRVVNIIKPKIIIGENVKGLLTRKNTEGNLFIDNIIEEFESIGYTMKIHLFNMKDYGLPQDRKRILIYGVRNNLKYSITLSNVCKSKVKKYNKDILEFSLKDALKIKSKIIDLITEDKYICDMKDKTEEYGKPPTNLIKCYETNAFSFKNRSKSTYSCIIDIDDISRTILSTYSRMPRLFVPIKNINGSYLRPYTILELQRIQGFPDSFEFKGNEINQIKQIGNAIPPIFIEKIMTYIKEAINGELLELL